MALIRTGAIARSASDMEHHSMCRIAQRWRLVKIVCFALPAIVALTILLLGATIGPQDRM